MRATSLGLLFALTAVGTTLADDWPPADDYINSLVSCETSKDPGHCKFTRATWQKEYDNAITGVYQGQRNVSFCLSTGCNDAIRQNKILGCAWRIVIIETGHLKADSTDTANLNYYCGREQVDETGRRAANAQARTMMKNLGVAQRLK
ncbi:Hypothetical protein NGAL_HAMBI2605_14910 [Neorhizobium galegae bv. orientalis]|nr:Hypothetical protein NGAL_HAMBI2605_14910 [Neorhizobium galegae bv. orientalis]